MFKLGPKLSSQTANCITLGMSHTVHFEDEFLKIAHNRQFTLDTFHVKIQFYTFTGCKTRSRNQSCGRLLLATFNSAFRYKLITKTEYYATSSGSMYRSKYSQYRPGSFKYSHGDTVLPMGPIFPPLSGKQTMESDRSHQKIENDKFPLRIVEFWGYS